MELRFPPPRPPLLGKASHCIQHPPWDLSCSLELRAAVGPERLGTEQEQRARLTLLCAYCVPVSWCSQQTFSRQYETALDGESSGGLQQVAYHTVNRRYREFLNLQTRLEEKSDLRKFIKSQEFPSPGMPACLSHRATLI